MNQENKQLLSELLTLKAGMSLLSIEVEKIISAEKDYEYKSQNYRCLRDRFEGEKKRIKNQKAIAEKQDVELKKYKAAQSGKKAFGGFLLILGVVLFVVGLTLWITPTVDVEGGIAILSLAGAAAGLWGLILLSPGKYNTPKAPQTRELTEYNMNKAHYKAHLQNLQKEKNKAEVEYRDAKALYEKTYDETYPLAKVIYETLYANYNETLRVRDWQYLDLVIHYIDSERADSKKEALLLVDKQVQNNNIVQAINNATIEICSTIRTVGDLIRFDMDRHFNALSSQLAAQHRQMIDSLSSVGGAIGSVSQKLEGIGSSQSMQNALLAKISVNSKKLAEDADYISRCVRNSY